MIYSSHCALPYRLSFLVDLLHPGIKLQELTVNDWLLSKGILIFPISFLWDWNLLKSLASVFLYSLKFSRCIQYISILSVPTPSFHLLLALFPIHLILASISIVHLHMAVKLPLVCGEPASGYPSKKSNSSSYSTHQVLSSERQGASWSPPPPSWNIF